MTTSILSLHLDHLQPSGRMGPLPAGDRAIYCLNGSVSLESHETSSDLEPDTGWGGHDTVTIESVSGALLYRWELGERDAPGVAPGSGFSTHESLAHEVTFPADECFFRCDRVEFPPGGIAYLHTHRGPGIRCLLRGELTVRVNAEETTIKPQEAWFEDGVDPVYAQASASEITAFARVMILPMEVFGKPSIRYIDEADKDKPKPQRYTVFFDKPITTSG